MMDKQEEFLEQFRPWLGYKTIEFITQGYESISSYDIASYFVTYRWKKSNLFEQIYQLNQLTINDYFDYESIMAQTSTEMTLDTIDLSALLD